MECVLFKYKKYVMHLDVFTLLLLHAYIYYTTNICQWVDDLWSQSNAFAKMHRKRVAIIIDTPTTGRLTKWLSLHLMVFDGKCWMKSLGKWRTTWLINNNDDIYCGIQCNSLNVCTAYVPPKSFVIAGKHVFCCW